MVTLEDIKGNEKDYVWDNSYERYADKETIIEVIFQNELSDEDHIGKTHDEIRKGIIDNLEWYLDVYNYMEVQV